MSPMHIGTNSNLFVVQWRWSVHQHYDTMTPWQTIAVVVFFIFFFFNIYFLSETKCTQF